MEDYGLIYLLANEAMPGMVKIGKTTRDAEARIRELYTTGVPLPFECLCACRVPMVHLDALEKAIHAAFSANRVSANREFFRISPDRAIPLFKVLTAMNGRDATIEVAEAIESGIEEADREAIIKAKGRRPHLDFFELGLQVGDTLTFVKDPLITASVESARRVRFNGVERSLTSVTAELLHKPYNVQPTQYWNVGEDNLFELYEQKHPNTEEE